MKKKELLKRIEELEAQVRDLQHQLAMLRPIGEPIRPPSPWPPTPPWEGPWSFSNVDQIRLTETSSVATVNGSADR